MLITAAHRRFHHQPGGVVAPTDMTTWFKFNTTTSSQNDGTSSTDCTIGALVSKVADNSLVDDDSHAYTAGTPTSSNHRIELGTTNFGTSHLDADFTVCFHAKAVELGQLSGNVWGVSESTSLNNYFALRLSSSNQVQAVWRENEAATKLCTVATKTITLNEEYHVCVKYDVSEGEVKVFVNGTDHSNSVATADLASIVNINNHRLGMVTRSSSSFAGKWHMGDVRIYDYILTDDEINAVRDDKKAY